MDRIARLAAIAVAGGLVVAGSGAAVGHADPAFGPSYQGGNCPDGLTCTHWCPGDPPIPGSHVIAWDVNICHDWYWNSDGVVDIASNTIYPWHGVPHEAPPPPVLGPPPPPAPPQPLPADCPPWSPILAPSRCGGL
ncbi:hypothetical protein [Mycobacterium sp. DBP42]|uniref:hypothetical protein n=1 Tax=Mycobacterium sp. DBP42 TaxID=2545267 RepID=UPI00110CA117|nr:hypothetical protein [Mycobacterium sp. DBP42]TMS54157.1 hypothetical protein E0T84_07900 [Mycobacterium sp. DBP42]